MNYKLEKFWNKLALRSALNMILWTINLKSFEIMIDTTNELGENEWTINLKSFEIMKL